MSSRIESSFSDIRSSFNYYEKYKNTYRILKSIPLFKKMEKKNKKLKCEIQRLQEENAKLLNTICCIQSGSSLNKSKKLMPIRELVKNKLFQKTNEEPVIQCKQEDSLIIDDEVTIIENPNVPNITYHVIDDDASFLENKKNIQFSSIVEADEVDAEEEEGDEEEAEEEEAEEEEEEADEVESVMINNKEYYTTNTTNGIIYNVDENGDITNEVGVFKNGVATFY